MATDDPNLDDEEFKGEPKSSKKWLTAIEDAERAYDDWQRKADSLDKLYANLNDLAATGRDRQFQMFWANIQVLGPSVYSRPPVPVVVPRFKDRKPVPRAASELLERSTVVGFELEDIDGVMRQVRDDLTVLARGCAWVRYDTKKGQKVCIEHTDRKDFLTHAARSWKEVDWVAKRSWLTKRAMRSRFRKTSGDAYKNASYEAKKDDEEDDGKLKAGVWELWCKSENRVVWVTEGVDVTLDEGEPHLDLEGFFPCPRPAYSTVQRRSLIPVPDMLFYKDQLEEINELTARIGALSDALQVRGFYPAGAGEIGDAIETAIKSTVNNQVLVPISNWAMVGQGGVKDMIVWLPIDQIATTVVQCVELRKQLIADVYEITGLSDIMRGSTDANETLGAQELKSQYGSVRIRDRQQELVRFARDLVRISAEIMAENFTSKTMLEMSQLDIPTDADIAKQIKPLEQQIRQIVAQVEQAKADPQLQAQAQQNPQAAQQMLQQAEQQAQGLKKQIDKLNETATVEKVMSLLRDQRTRPFVLDIETDSTIAPDENAQKQRATEFMTVFTAAISQGLPVVQQAPQSAKLFAEGLKFLASQYRAGRQLEGTIEEFADDMAIMAQQPKQDPMAAKGAAEAEAIKQNMAVEQARHQREEAAAAQDQKRKDAEALAKEQREQQAHEYDEKCKNDEEARKVQENDIKLSNMAADERRKAVEHRQRVELNALAITKARVDIAGKEQQAQNDMAMHDAEMAGMESEEGAAPAPEPETEDMQPDRFNELAQLMAEGFDQLARLIAAPKVLVRDANGRPVGAQISLPQMNGAAPPQMQQ